MVKKNAMNSGGQRTEGSITKQEIHDIVDNSEYKYTKEDICSICNCSIRTFESFASSLLSERDFISVGSSHKKIYTESVLQNMDEEIVFSGCEFPTCMVSPTAVPKLISYLHIL